MFLENTTGVFKVGWIELICGSMFSGKTEELLRRIKRAAIANQQTILFKPSIDKRYSTSDVVSHDKTSTPSTVVESSHAILEAAGPFQVIGIDEAQFFDMDLPLVCNNLANAGKRVIVAGLDMDFEGQPFGPVPQLASMAEYVSKVHAICVKCGNLAHYSHRKNPSREKIFLGETENYEPLCRNCFLKTK